MIWPNVHKSEFARPSSALKRRVTDLSSPTVTIRFVPGVSPAQGTAGYPPLPRKVTQNGASGTRAVFFASCSQHAALGHGDRFALADDHVVQHADFHQAERLDQGPGDIAVGPAGLGDA